VGVASPIEVAAYDAVRDWTLSALAITTSLAAEGIAAVSKGTAFDVITEADRAVERHLREQVAQRFPDHAFVGEEEGGEPLSTDDWQWVVDPIDGTLDLATGLPGACVSIALARGPEPIVGAIGDVASGRAYRSLAGGRTVLCHDGTSEAEVVPAPTPLGEARIFVEWGWEGLDEVMVGTLAALGDGRPRVLRIAGGAAFAMLHVALHGGCFLGLGLRMWDVAAGIVIAREAGRIVDVRRDGDRVHVIAGTRQDVSDLAPVVERFGMSRHAAAGTPHVRAAGGVGA
jgi:fructose-1,6-bisphosphatase/inositol monophosphatase family enzyme